MSFWVRIKEKLWGKGVIEIRPTLRDFLELFATSEMEVYLDRGTGDEVLGGEYRVKIRPFEFMGGDGEAAMRIGYKISFFDGGLYYTPVFSLVGTRAVPDSDETVPKIKNSVPKNKILDGEGV
jgi:hypothetical protein